MTTQTADFDFDLPPDRIAHQPANPRDSAKMLRVTATGLIDAHVRDLPSLLRPHDILVVNDTKVIPAQLTAHRGAAGIGITLDRPLANGKTWFALLRNSKRVHVGDTLVIDGAADFTATVTALPGDGAAHLQFTIEGAAFLEKLHQAGALALPPYIPRAHGPTARDAIDYQTAYAKHEGAVAAPTAGLHFTPELLAKLDAAGIERATVTLHVGAGTFLPVRVDKIEDHRMHPERGTIDAATAAQINQARARGGRIIAVGTTSLRLLETAADENGQIRPYHGETSIFIHPPIKVRTADLLLTNFHLPKSTLFMLVSAFAGLERMRQAYAHAIANGYRFYSFGDACLLERMP